MRYRRRIPWDEILRRLKGTSDAESEAVLSVWLEQSPLNREVFSELAVLWESVRQEDMDFDVDAAWAQVKELTIRRNNEKHASDHAGRRFRRWVAGAACAAAAALFMVAGYYAAGTRPVDYLCIEKYTPLKGKSRFLLSDGTEVCLREGSSISLKESQLSGRREVLLQGEANFHVAHAGGRQFVVRTGDVAVCVYGTEFNVRTEAESGDVLVSLQEGSVQLNTPARTLMMTPGDIVRCSADGSAEAVQGDVLQETCWTKNGIDFKGWTLRDVCDCLSRWYDVKISVEPEIAGLYKYNFSLRNESLDEILSMMALASPIGYTFRLDGSVQVARK